jgi:hypothetical protein
MKKHIKPKYSGFVFPFPLKDIKYAPSIEKIAPIASSIIIIPLI